MSELQPYSPEQKLSHHELVANRVTQLEQQNLSIDEQIASLLKEKEEINELLGIAGQVLAFLKGQETVLELEQAGVIPAGTYSQQKAQAELFLAQEKVETVIEPNIQEPESNNQEDPQPPTNDNITTVTKQRGDSDDESTAIFTALAMLKAEGIDESISSTLIAEITAHQPENNLLIDWLKKNRSHDVTFLQFLEKKCEEAGISLIRVIPTPPEKKLGKETQLSLSGVPELRTVEYTEEKVGDDIHATFVRFEDEKKPEDLKKKA